MGRPFPIPDAPPLAEQNGATYPSLVALMRRLLETDGCPWDQEQDYASLRKYVLEEACEVIDAIDDQDFDGLREELGDLALQVVFLGELARREGRFGPDDVVRAIVEKLVRRHPHVFGDATVEGSEDVLKNWERIKAEEKSGRGVLDGVPRALPALQRAQRMSEKVSRVGFDWPDGRGSRLKVSEELDELDQAIAGKDPKRIEAELGDLLFALVNMARHHGVDAETALRGTADRFARRFSHVERRVKEEHGGFTRAPDGKPLPGPPLDVLDRYWDEAKEQER
ncbi:MAG TPA: nucleoside triphosphate pyrophosphohydrolase [Polyangiaceae bacterium]|jgi:tetrapyrrole methylase family protein/MazG family protein/ATP diphosphatase|nr:nucleoside triphosphate pyrophosphohydrolase [Polyangiaceae bacterium]